MSRRSASMGVTLFCGNGHFLPGLFAGTMETDKMKPADPTLGQWQVLW